MERVTVADAPIGVDVVRCRRAGHARPRTDHRRAYGVSVDNGGTATVRNSLITTDSGWALFASADPARSTSLTARNVTLVAHGAAAFPAVEARVQNALGYKDVNVTVSDSVIRGFPPAYSRTATAFGVGVGDAFVAFDHTIVTRYRDRTRATATRRSAPA